MHSFYTVTHSQIYTPNYISTLGVWKRGKKWRWEARHLDEEIMVLFPLMGMTLGKSQFSSGTRAFCTVDLHEKYYEGFCSYVISKLIQLQQKGKSTGQWSGLEHIDFDNDQNEFTFSFSVNICIGFLKRPMLISFAASITPLLLRAK